MNRVVAIVEGRTEQAFCRDVLAPTLAASGVFLYAQLVGKPGHKGGATSWTRVQRDILAALKQESQRACTTMFDFYGLPREWPGLSKARRKPFRAAVDKIERAMHKDVCTQMGSSFASRLFLPYVQVHEFEALLFCSPEALSEVLERSSLASEIQRIVADAGEPEAIDDRPDTCPSKRISSLAPHFRKTLHGSIAAKRIGIERMRERCPHFSEWLAKLERLSS